MRKGNLVRLSVARCFTIESGGCRSSPLSNWEDEEQGRVRAFYKLSAHEREQWRSSPQSMGMTSSGETKLCPYEGCAYLYRKSVYTIVKARAATTVSYSRIGGLMLVCDTTTGKNVFVPRKLMELVR